MKKIANILLVIFILVSCQNKNLYTDTTTEPTEPTTPADEDKTTVDYSSPYIYPFSDEVNNAVTVITIKANKDIKASSIIPEVPYLKYNKSWLLMLTQDDVKQAIYCRTWAKINGKPTSSSTYYDGKHDLYYDYPHLVNNDLPPTIISAQDALGSTDGAGNTVRFAVTATVRPEASWMNTSVTVDKNKTDNYYRFYMKSGLVWYDVMDMMNYGTGLAFHNVNATDEKDATQVLQHYMISQDTIVKRLSGRGCKMLAEPDGNKVYVEAALKYPLIQTMTAQAGTVQLYPFKVTTDLKDVLINRIFYSVTDLKQDIQSQLSLKKEDRSAVCIGVHSTDDTWLDCLQWINDNYGKKGDDSVWFPSQEEYYEYNYYRIHGVRNVEQVDSKTIKLTVSLPSGTYFYYPSITVNLQGLTASDVNSISTNDVVTGLSYANYDSTLMLNVDCRKHLGDMATHYVELYEKDKTNTSNKADASYFVNMLKPGTLKETLLKRVAQ
jgi:hypothetical protein